MYSYGSPHMAAQKQDDQLERTFSSYVRIQVVFRKTYLGRWTIGRSGERGSGISVLPARYDDDDDTWGRIEEVITFQRTLMQNEMQMASIRIWTQVTNSISYGNDHYAKCTSLFDKVYDPSISAVIFFWFVGWYTKILQELYGWSVNYCKNEFLSVHLLQLLVLIFWWKK